MSRAVPPAPLCAVADVATAAAALDQGAFAALSRRLESVVGAAQRWSCPDASRAARLARVALLAVPAPAHRLGLDGPAARRLPALAPAREVCISSSSTLSPSLEAVVRAALADDSDAATCGFGIWLEPPLR